jgi:hypothetical protein
MHIFHNNYLSKVNQELARKAEGSSKILPSISKEINLLNMVLTYRCDEKDKEEDRAVAVNTGGEVDFSDAPLPVARRKRSKLSALSGAPDDD